MKTLLLNETYCPPQYLLDWYCEDLMPDNMVWQIENHLCDCQNCTEYVSKRQGTSIITDSLDAAMAVKLFLLEPVCTPIPEYETMLDMVLMSAATANDIQPTDGHFITQNQLSFRWKNLDTLQLQIENNNYQKLFDQLIPSNYSLPLPLDTFPNGLYYFKLLNGIDLVKVGKFYVYR